MKIEFDMLVLKVLIVAWDIFGFCSASKGTDSFGQIKAFCSCFLSQ